MRYTRIEVNRDADGRPVREYLNVWPGDARPAPREPDRDKRSRWPGERPRIFIVGPQRILQADGDINEELELRFTDARALLCIRGYEGIFVRMVPYRAWQDPGSDRFHVTIFPGGGGTVPDKIWHREVRERMRYCVGVAVLDAPEIRPNVQWERRLARRRFGLCVRPLKYWLRGAP